METQRRKGKRNQDTGDDDPTKRGKPQTGTGIPNQNQTRVFGVHPGSTELEVGGSNTYEAAVREAEMWSDVWPSAVSENPVSGARHLFVVTILMGIGLSPPPISLDGRPVVPLNPNAPGVTHIVLVRKPAPPPQAPAPAPWDLEKIEDTSSRSTADDSNASASADDLSSVADGFLSVY